MIDAADRNFLIPCSCIFCYINNSERMIEMIVEAINKRTGKAVKIEEAYSGQRLTCPYCGVEVHPVLEVATPFFRCYEGGKHTNYLCEQLERTNRAYDPQITDITELFVNLFNPVREKEDFPWEPEDDEDSDALDPEDETLDGDEPTQTSRGGTDDGGDGENEAASGPVILPCKTLSQLWKAGIYKLGSSERIGSFLRSDIFLWYKDFDRFFARHEDLGERVLAVRPLWPVNKANAILFASFSSIRGSKEYKKKYFVLEFQERKEYNKACKKLFIRNTEYSGTSRTVSKYDMVLVAGDWTELDEEEYAVFVKPGENVYGVQSSLFYSKNQIYPIPQHKKKA